MQGRGGHASLPRALKLSRVFYVFGLTPAFLRLAQEPISLTLLSSVLSKEWGNFAQAGPGTMPRASAPSPASFLCN